MDKNDILVKKWGPIIKDFGVKNEELVEKISIFCEKNIIDNPNNVELLVNNLKNILDKISKKRVEVIKTYYNPFYGSFEYELSNGLIVNEGKEFTTDLTTQDMVDIFGIEFTRELNPQEFREERIKNIRYEI